MNEALVVTDGRGRLINTARPQWVMLGADWDGPGVLLLASRTLKSVELDFRARSYEFRDIADLLARFRPELTLTVHMDDDYVLVAGATFADCLAELLQHWQPDDLTAHPLAIESP